MGLSKRSWYSKARTVVFAILTLSLVWWTAVIFGEVGAVRTLKAPLTRFEFNDGEFLNAHLIGKTNDTYFVYTKERTVSAIPITGNLRSVGLPLPESEALRKAQACCSNKSPTSE